MAPELPEADHTSGPPAELCGVWAYIKWEADGRPSRSAADADAEYQHAVQARVCQLLDYFSASLDHDYCPGDCVTCTYESITDRAE